MLIFAHRGLKLEAPENTLEAYKAAAASGFGIELDVRLSKDQELVCIHDLNPARIAGESAVMNIHEASVAQLQELNVGKVFWQWREVARIPRFLDVVRQVIVDFKPGQRAAIHVKEAEQGDTQLKMLAAIFKEFNLYEKAFIFDFTLASAAKLKAMDSKIQIFISVGEDRFTPTIYKWEDLSGKENLFDGIWWDEWKTAGSEYTAERAAEIKKAGKILYAISPELHLEHGHPHSAVGYYQEWERFKNWGVDGVCAAYPKALKEFLK